MMSSEENTMDNEKNAQDLAEAIRHAHAGLKALEAAEGAMTRSGQLYPTHLYVATVELAHAIEVAMKCALRNI
jgi:hypothetical protein